MESRKRHLSTTELTSPSYGRLEARNLLASLVPIVDAASDSSIDWQNEVCFVSDKTVSSTNVTPRSILKLNEGVVGRSLFYNDSVFDGNDAAANANDDNAIATDKVAFFPGETATFSNYSSFTKGINGIIVDAHLTDAASFTANDVILKVGTGNDLSDFERLEVSADVTVRAGEGVDGSDRITVVLPNESVVNQYLQVTIIANATTGLDSDDVFYFGNVIAETGDSSGDTFINADDIGRIRSNLSGFFPVGADSPFDLNRDQFVNASDIGVARNNLSGFFPVPLITAPESGDEFLVTSAADIDNIASQVQPGDTIILQDGIWTDQQIHVCNNGTEASPITIRAQTPGKVILNGNSTLNIGGDWVVADGLHFNRGSLDAGDHVVEFRSSCGDANHSRLTNSAITNYNPSDINTRYFWVSIHGQHNRVDHNSFSGQNHSGVTVTVWRDSSAADHHLIDHNYFANRPEGNGNGFETIRIGTSAESLSSSFTTVEHNLFEAADGEIEIISNKSGNNIFRYNTFRDSAGTLTLRHGDNNLVEGNFFLGGGKDRTGGVRVIGENQTIVNNYFEGLDGRSEAAIAVTAGVQDSALNEYFQVKNALIAHNTIVDVNGAGIVFDQGFGSSSRTLRAEDVTIANNLISSTQDPLFTGTEGTNWTWEGNIAFGQSLGPKDGDAGITVVDPQLEQDATGFWRPNATSPAIDGSSGDYATALGSIDIDGQTRDAVFDVGADEASSDPVLRRPLVAGDVGSFWMRSTGDEPECSCLTIQSDEYASALDPNGDGDNWVVGEDNDALGGSMVVAPVGNRVTLPGTHDAILTYSLQFSEAGTYTAYYRARGFDGSSDSLYTPSDFGVDPDVNESLSNDGVYRWETGATFEVTESDVGGALDFRIGKRESGTNLDAIVFHLDAGLTDAELDALFE